MPKYGIVYDGSSNAFIQKVDKANRRELTETFNTFDIAKTVLLDRIEADLRKLERFRDIVRDYTAKDAD